MYFGMDLEDFKKEWFKLFAKGVPKEEIEKCHAYDLIWHIFSWEVISPKEYLEDDDAREAFDKADKSGAWYIVPFVFRGSSYVEEFEEEITAEELEGVVEVYVVAKDFSWTYIKTHEAGIGPYFYVKK